MNYSRLSEYSLRQSAVQGTVCPSGSQRDFANPTPPQCDVSDPHEQAQSVTEGQSGQSGVFVDPVGGSVLDDTAVCALERTSSLNSILEPAGAVTSLVIDIPPRSRGRPKTSTKAKKAQQKKAAVSAQEDSDL
ncbi:hypothetical protein L914_21706 [Phytophthora nicotianae]|uniref:Uncharacterized protein n=1 Tax=Phytophthora nicotianae TaxID=4792 RepID=W2M2K6_PHYNI|nr:hypothetical protein L914_21706 [Phytophthora nicotianae]